MATEDFDNTLIQIGKKKRKFHFTEGDVFALSVENGKYLWGRVVRIHHVIYKETVAICKIYKYETLDLTPPTTWRDEDMLIGLENLDHYYWRDGQFVTVENQPLSEAEMLTRYCFTARIFFPKEKIVYVDEHKKLTDKFEPCLSSGLFTGVPASIREALHNLRTLKS